MSAEFDCNKVFGRRQNADCHPPAGWVVACLVPLAVWATPASARVLYVNASAKAGTAVDGTSWKRAFRDLQDALALAQPGDEVWIAAGTYRPDRGTGDRDMSFTVEGGVALYGGFSGRESTREQRNWVRNETVLSGDLNGDDGPRNCAEVSNCCVEHDEYSCDDAECQLRVCSIWPECCDERGSRDGWDDLCADSAKEECCYLGSWNSCENSAVIVHVPDGDEAAVIDGVRISGAYDADSIGVRDAWTAGIDLGATSLTLRNCTISDNARSGVISLENAPTRTVTVEACRFVDNGSVSGLTLYTHKALVSNSVFDGNAVGMTASGATVVGCVFSNNSHGLELGGAGNVVEDSWFIGNVMAARMDGLGSSARVSRCNFVRNVGGLTVDSGTVSDCVFLDNGQGALAGGFGTADVRRCVILGTGYGTEKGGYSAVLVEDGGLILRDSVVAGTRIYGSAAVYVDFFSSAVIRNTVVVDNQKFTRNPTGISADLSDVSVENSIVWGNSDRDGIAEDTQIGGYDSTIEVNNSIVQEWSGALGGVGNSGDDPLFVDPLGPDGLPGTGDEDYHLSPDSPAIDAGNPGFTPYSGQTDLDGFSRVLCGRVDMGAYEFGIGDYDCNQVVDLFDFAAWESCMTAPGGGPIAAGCEAFDFNADAAVDLADYAGFQNVVGTP